MKRLLSVFVFSLITLCFTQHTVCAGARFQLIGKQPPEIQARHWLNTMKVPSLAQFKGKVIVLEFWATWCPPCRKSIPHLIKLYRQYQSQGVEFISLTAEKISKVKPFVSNQRIPYTIGTGSTTSRNYGISGIPHAVVIGRDGTVVWEGHPMNGLNEALKKAAAR